MKKILYILLIFCFKNSFSQTTLFPTRVLTVINADTGRGVTQLATGGSLNKVRDSIISVIPAAGASTTLNNLGTTNINAALLAQTGLDLGSTTKPFRSLFLYGSGTYGTNYFNFTGTPTSTRTITIPDITGTLATLAGTEALTNKTVNGLTITSSTGTLTIPNTASLILSGAFAATNTYTATTNATFPSGTGTLAYLAGTNTWSAVNTFSNSIVPAVIQTSATAANSDLYVANATGYSAAQSTAYYLFSGATSVQFRTAFAGNTGTTLTAGNSAANVIIGSTTSIEAGSGTHANNSSLVVLAPVITQGVGSTTDAATVYISGAPTGTATITNEVTALWVASGTSLFGGSMRYAYRSISALRTLDNTDYSINCTNAPYTVTLPNSTGITGKVYIISNSSVGTITIATTSSQVFSNVTATPTTLTLVGLGSYTVQSTNGAWIVL